MKKLILPMRDKIPQILLIFAFLLIQVYCDLTLPQYTADIVNIGIQNTDFQFIIDTGVMMLSMVAISALATVAVSYFSSRVSSGYAKDLRKIVYEKVLKFSNHELNDISRSSLITRSTNDINQLQSVLGMIFTTMLFAPILGVGSIIKAFELGTDLSWIIAVTFSYFANRIFVFESKNPKIFKEMISFFSARLVTLLLDMGTMFVLATLLQINYNFSKIIAMVLVTVGNYVISKVFVFKKGK